MIDYLKEMATFYSALAQNGFYFINGNHVIQAFMRAQGQLIGLIMPPPPLPYAELVAPFQEALEAFLERRTTPDAMEAESHRIIIDFSRKDFGEWFSKHPAPPFTTRSGTLWDFYRLVNDLRYYQELRMWECHSLSPNAIERLTKIQLACARFGHPLKELPKVLPAIAAKDIPYLENFLTPLLAETTETYQHFCQDEAEMEEDSKGSSFNAADFASLEERLMGQFSAISKTVDGIAQDTAVLRNAAQSKSAPGQSHRLMRRADVARMLEKKKSVTFGAAKNRVTNAVKAGKLPVTANDMICESDALIWIEHQSGPHPKGIDAFDID